MNCIRPSKVTKSGRTGCSQSSPNYWGRRPRPTTRRRRRAIQAPVARVARPPNCRPPIPPQGADCLAFRMKPRLNLLLMGLCVCSCTCPWPGPGPAPYCGTVKTKDSFALVQDNAAAPLWVDAGDFPGVLRAANDLCRDVGRVTGRTPPVSRGENAPGANVIL